MKASGQKRKKGGRRAGELARLVEGLPPKAGALLQATLEELSSAQRDLDAERARYAELFELAPDGYLLTDLAGVIREANRAAGRMFGLPPARLTGRPLGGFVADEDLHEFALHLDQLPRSERPLYWEVRLKPAEGNAFQAAASVAPAREPTGEVSALRWILRDVTQSRWMLRALKESEERLKEAQKMGRMGNWEYEVDTGKVTWSDQVFSIYERDPSLGPLSYEQLFSYGTPEENERLRDNVTRAIQRGERAEADYRLKLRSGRTVYHTGVILSVKDATGRVVKLVGTVQDITERKQAEEALRRSQEGYRRIVETANEGVWAMDAQARTTFVNQTMADMLGEPPESMLGRPVSTFMFPEDLGDHDTKVMSRREGIPERYERRFKRRDGSEVWFIVSATPLTDPGGGFAGSFGMFTDITERKRIEQALKSSEEKYRAIFENALEGIYQTTPEGRYLSVNPSFARMFGYASPEEMIASVTDIGSQLYVRPEDRERLKSLLLEAGIVEKFEAQCRRKDGETIWISINARTVRGPDGAIRYFEGTNEDITERKRAEAALRETRDYLENLFHYANAPIIVWDPDLLVSRFNHAFERLTGLEAEEVVGQSLEVLFPDEAREEAMNHVRKATAGGRMEGVQIPVRGADGGTRTVLWNSANLYGPDGRSIVATMAHGHDITELKRAQKFETIGMVAGGMAHEVRNPLFALSSIAAAMEKKLEGDPEHLACVTHIQDQVKRLSSLMNDLLTLGRPPDPATFADCVLQEVLDESLRNIETVQPGSRGKTVARAPRKPLTVKGRAESLTQVFLNLLQNALQHSSPDDHIEIRLWDEDGQAFISFRDCGPGIPPDLLPTLFEPFSSRRRGGTGLGLAIVRTIAMAHGGGVTAANNHPEPGATFTVRLPLCPTPSPEGHGDESAEKRR